jgi:type II secretory pathway pseudopilin PulG
MRNGWQKRTARRKESGYALILVMFFLALLVLSMAAAAPTVLSNVRREREAEMVWRGKQYTRGVRMYYLKMNRFPTSLDDLTKPKTGIRFMRQAYKDPMNQVDGSWRLIYVGPNGQLIGSLSDRSIGLTGMSSGGVNGAQGKGNSLFTMGNGQGSMNNGANSMNSSGFGMNQSLGSTQNGAMGTALANGATPTEANGAGDANGTNGKNDSSTDMSQPHSLTGPMDASNTIGGNIIGVGSKINKKSFMVYEKAKNYRLFEFIWDPSKDMTVGRASTGIGTPIQNMNGTNPTGTANPNSPFSTGMNPGQNQNQNQSQNPNSNTNTNPDPNQMPPLQAPQ